ncbi:MAG TPA: hypothetical protein VGD59_04735 [Acidisarcina sp.]
MKSIFSGKTLSMLNLHIAGLAVLLILDCFLGVRLLIAWHAAGADREEQIAQAQISAAQLQAQTQRLSGLPARVDRARNGAAEFYSERMPANYSSIAGNLGELYARDGVRLTRASYTQTPAILDLAEIRIDANVSGEYTNVMRFINAVERDKTFFVVDALTLTGQQGGLVNLRLRLTTYLHSSDANGIPEAEVSRPDMEGVR